MSWTPSNYKTLKVWRGANKSTTEKMSDHEAAEAYNAETRPGKPRELGPREFYGAISAGEVAKIQSQALDDKASAYEAAAALTCWFDQIGTVDLTPGSAPRGYIDALVSAGVITAGSLQRLIDASATTIPLWQADGCSRPANHGDIAWVKREMKDV